MSTSATVLAIALVVGLPTVSVPPVQTRMEIAQVSYEITNESDIDLNFTYKGQTISVGSGSSASVPRGATISGTQFGRKGTYQVVGPFRVMGMGPYVVTPGGNLKKIG